MFHVEANILFHGTTTEFNTAVTKNTGNQCIDITTLMQPTLTHYELHFLHVAHTCSYDRQSSHVTFTMTVTSYNQVTQNPH